MLLGEVNPVDLFKAQLQNAPEFMDIISRSPLVLSEAFKRFENGLVEKKRPLTQGVQNTIFGGCCIIGGSILAAAGLDWVVYTPLLVLGFILALKS